MNFNPLSILNQNDNNIEILGARENNLQNIDLKFHRNKFIVFTGISGSGKSSLAFNTIYAEGQRRYMESFSAYARSFIGQIERPDVDKINGLSPVISIEQKTTSKNPRSTVGTLTEIYDFLRLLFARTAAPYSYITGNRMIKQTFNNILSLIESNYKKKNITILSPLVKGRKGNYKELFLRISKMGFTQVRIDGKILDMTKNMQLDRYTTHDIELVVDRLKVEDLNKKRIQNSIKIALEYGESSLYIMDENNSIKFYSKNLTDPDTGLSYEDPAPNNFSFNSPYGACKTCKGLGVIEEIKTDSIIEDKNLSISRGGIIPLGTYRDIWIFKKIESILKINNLDIRTPIKKIPSNILHEILYGRTMQVGVESIKYPGTIWRTNYEGVISLLIKQKNRKQLNSQKVLKNKKK